ncbi:MAG TPA: PIN domain-containing protein [Solirubrobacterales bacterium]
MSRTDAPRAVLDSDILFSRVLHELMGRVAKRLELLDLVWSEELLAEARRSLVEKKGLSKDAAARWVGYLPQNFPGGEIDPTGVAASIDLSTLTDDSDDHHVCELAIASGAAYLFTHDRGYLSSALQGHGVEVVAPDSFLASAFDDASEGFLDLLELQAAEWAGGRPINELLAAVERAGAKRFAGKVRAALGS